MSHGHDHHEHHTAKDYERALVEHDSWFRHDASEPQHQEAHGQTKPLMIVVFLAMTIVFVAIVAFLCIQYFNAFVRSEQTAKIERNEAYYADARRSRAEWQSQLSGYGWVDAQAGQARVPIDVAMRQVIAEYGRPASGDAGR